jgi:urease beta subunit
MNPTNKSNTNERRNLHMLSNTAPKRIQIGQHLLFISCPNITLDYRKPRRCVRYANQN